MAARTTRFLDETWKLALAGDAAGLRRVAALLLAEDLIYDGRRARAFALALDADVEGALRELGAGLAEDWPFPPAYAADTARIRYLAGDDEGALAALRSAVHDAERLDPALAELAVAVVSRAPRLRLRAVGVVLGGGSPLQRLGNATRVLVKPLWNR